MPPSTQDVKLGNKKLREDLRTHLRQIEFDFLKEFGEEMEIAVEATPS